MSEREVGYRIAKDGECPKFYLAEDVEKLIAAKDKEIEDMKVNEYIRSVDDGMEIRRLHRCVVLMTLKWLGAIDEMYSRLDDVHGMDDDDVDEWEKVSHLRKKLKKVLEKWK